MAKQYREKIEKELKDICQEVLVRLLSSSLSFGSSHLVSLDFVGQVSHSESDDRRIESVLLEDERRLLSISR